MDIPQKGMILPNAERNAVDCHHLQGLVVEFWPPFARACVQYVIEDCLATIQSEDLILDFLLLPPTSHDSCSSKTLELCSKIENLINSDLTVTNTRNLPLVIRIRSLAQSIDS